MRSYDDIKHLSRPQYIEHPPMSIHDRAAQFSPFAALVGYGEAVAETSRLTERRREISEEELSDLNIAVNRLLEILPGRPLARVLHFVPDSMKDGGRYEEKRGNIRAIDNITDQLVFVDGDRINLEDLYRIEFIEEEKQDASD